MLCVCVCMCIEAQAPDMAEIMMCLPGLGNGIQQHRLGLQNGMCDIDG